MKFRNTKMFELQTFPSVSTSYMLKLQISFLIVHWFNPANATLGRLQSCHMYK